MTFYMFSQKRFEEVKAEYMSLERRFNRLAGYFNNKDCKKGMWCLSSAETLIARMGYGSGDLEKNMGDCILDLKNLRDMVIKYERNLKDRIKESQKHLPEDDEMRLAEDEINNYTIEDFRIGSMEGFGRVMRSADIETSIVMFAEYINWVKMAHEKTGKTPKEILESAMGLDPEEVALFLDAIEEDKIIKIDKIEQPKRKKASGMEPTVMF